MSSVSENSESGPKATQPGIAQRRPLNLCIVYLGVHTNRGKTNSKYWQFVYQVGNLPGKYRPGRADLFVQVARQGGRRSNSTAGAGLGGRGNNEISDGMDV